MRLAAIVPEIIDQAVDFAAREATGLTADSRSVKADWVFFAVPGTKSDGLSFAAQAIANGAIAIVAERLPDQRAQGVAYVTVADVRRALAKAAARFYPLQPATIVAITGTSGKTSVADFVRQILTSLGRSAASLGTIGLIKPDGARYGALTTPDPVTLHKTLDQIAREGVTHLAMEASSHGLDQRRLDGVHLAAAAFTNLSRDHLDYHATFDDYLAAKLRLFNTLLAPGQPAVIDADSDMAARVIASCVARRLSVLTVGMKGEVIRLIRADPDGLTTRLSLSHDGRDYDVRLPLVGAFQVSNALVAAGLAVAIGENPAQVFGALANLRGARGRLELVGAKHGAPVFVDYAHKPDALEKALRALRPFASRRLVVVFGCGGDRDAGKRSIMGEVAVNNADVAIVTDDNPRSEDPAKIRAAILAGAPAAIEIADRGSAIAEAIGMLGPGDALLIAGKGHEVGQIVGNHTLPFSDHHAVKTALVRQDITADAPLWTGLGLVAPLEARVSGALPIAVAGISIDTRTLVAGDLFFAIKGETNDGHDFVRAAFDKGAAAAVVDEAHAEACKTAGPLYVVRDVLSGLERLGRASRQRSRARIVAVTGSVGKTSTKEALRIALSTAGETHASVASYNNHVGVPLTLARLPQTTRFGVFEIGMNHAGEIAPLSAMVRPHVAIVTTVAPVHLEHFSSVAAIADAKAEIFSGLVKGGVAMIHRDIAEFDRLLAQARISPAGHVVSFGEHPDSDARLIAIESDSDGSQVTADILGRRLEYRIGAPGKHLAINSLAVLLAAKATGVELSAAAAALAGVHAQAGRGQRITLTDTTGTVIVIDESYNANPASMHAALALLGQSTPRGNGRRIAVLGDMLELGPQGATLHRSLTSALQDNSVDLLLAAGPLMRELFDSVAAPLQGFWAARSTDLVAAVLETVRGGDVVMVKGSLGSQMAPIVAALQARFADRVDAGSQHPRTLKG